MAEYFNDNPTIPLVTGRVTLVPGESVQDYPLFSEPGSAGNSASSVRLATLGSLRNVDVHDSAVARLFFSDRCIDALQDGLRYRVNQASLQAGAAYPGYIIGRQNERELGIVMRGVYQQFGRNMPHNVEEQVRNLTGKVLNFVVPRVLQEVSTYRKYLVDISTPRSLIAHGLIAGTKGDKQLGIRPT